MCHPFAAFSLHFVCPFSLIVETLEELGVAVDVGMPTATPPTTPTTLVSTIPTVPFFAVPSVLVSAFPIAPIHIGPSEFLFLYLLLHCLFASLSFLDHGFSNHALHFLLGPLPTVPSQFEMSNNSAAVPNPVSEVIAFFTRFDQPEVNDLNPTNFWGSRPSYVDFHGFRVPEDCASHLLVVYSSCGDFMQGFCLSRSAREYFLKMLESVMNNIEHNFVDTISIERIL